VLKEYLLVLYLQSRPAEMTPEPSTVQFSDGNQMVHFVSFEPKLWSQINDARANSTAVSLKNYCVKRGRQNDLEDLATSHTSIHNSPKKFKVDHQAVQEDDAKCHSMQTLEQLKDIAEHQYISVSGTIPN